MSLQHCKNVTEDLFERDDRHFQYELLAEPFSDLQDLYFPKTLKQPRKRKFRKSTAQEF